MFMKERVVFLRRFFLIVFTFICLVMVYSRISAEEMVIPDASIRLRVVPNSNSYEDIYMKGLVKDYLEDNVYMLFRDSDDLEEARDIVNDNIDTIREDIERIFYVNNYDMSFDINYGLNFFPEKEYNGRVYKEGDYESLVVYIGEAKGDNFWCVLFPNFCLLDSDKGKNAEYRFFLKEVIDKYL